MIGDSILINFPYHQPNIPTPTDEMINVYNATRNATKNATGVSDDFEQRLIKAHGNILCNINILLYCIIRYIDGHSFPFTFSDCSIFCCLDETSFT